VGRSRGEDTARVLLAVGGADSGTGFSGRAIVVHPALVAALVWANANGTAKSALAGCQAIAMDAEPASD